MGRRRRRSRCVAGVRHVWTFRVVRFVFFNRSSGSSFVFFLPLFVIYTRLIIISCKILPSFLTVPGTFRKGALHFKIHVRTVCAHACSLFLHNRMCESHKILTAGLQVSFCPGQGAKIGIVNCHMMLTKLPFRVLDKSSKGEEKSCIFW